MHQHLCSTENIREVHPFAYASLLIHYGYYLRYCYRNFQNLFILNTQWVFFKIFLNTFRILSFLDSDHLYPCKTYVLMGHIYICMCGLRCNLVLHSCTLLSYKIRPCAGPKGNVSFRNTYLFSLLCIGKGMVKLDSYNIVTVAEFIFPLFSISFLTSLSFQKDSEIWREKNKNK